VTLEILARAYFLTNLAIIVGYGVVRLLQLSGGRPIARLRIAQSLLLVSVLAVPAWMAISTEATPILRLPDMAPHGETSVAAPVRAASKMPQLRNTTSAKVAAAQPDISAWIYDRRLPIAAGLFILGVVLSASRLFRNLFRLRAILARALPIRRQGRVNILLSDDVAVPFSTRVRGFADVVLPIHLIGVEPDYRIALRHEIQHHRQGDTPWALLIEALQIFFFANPFLSLWKREIQELQEFSCDEVLTGRRGISPRDYGLCLLRVAESAAGFRAVYAGTAWMAATSGGTIELKSQLRRRIEMFTSPTTGRQRVTYSIGLLAITLVALGAYATEKISRPPETAPVNPGTPDFDPEVQRIAERALKEGLEKIQAKSGFAIVAEPGSGRLLAAAEFSDDPSHPKNWALSALVEPASISKVFVTALALERNRTTLDTTYDCGRGRYTYAGHTILDYRAFDKLTTADTLLQSSNICGLHISKTLRASELDRGFRDFGFGPGGSSAEFPSARVGKLPSPRMSDEERRIAFNLGYSQIVSSPLEVVQAFGAIANGGRLMRPIQFSDGDDKIHVVRQVLREEVARDLRQVLHDVTLRGTAKVIGQRPYRMAGKTATTKGTDVGDGNWGMSNAGSFIGFAPALQPRLVIYVVTNDPGTSEPVGSRHAAPIFARIAEEALRARGVAPDQDTSGH